MKELRSVTANFHMLFSVVEATPLVEVVLLLSEPKYAVDDAGSLSKRRDLTDFRFSTSSKGLRDLATSLVELADQCDREAARFMDVAEVPR